MALRIKNPETERRARELARTTGESLTEAVTKALRDRLLRETGRDPDSDARRFGHLGWMLYLKIFDNEVRAADRLRCASSHRRVGNVRSRMLSIDAVVVQLPDETVAPHLRCSRCRNAPDPDAKR